MEMEVSKEAYELMHGLVELVKVIKLAMADGFQPGMDLPAIVMGAMAILPKAIEGLDQLDEESKELEPFIKAFLVGGSEISAIFKK